MTDQPVLSGTKLYVDGQEMQLADSSTNFTDSTGVTNYEVDTYSINTCEWLNGNHILFATTACQSGRGDAVDAPEITVGHGVSPFVSVGFNNLVGGISFSQASFDPSLGETQQVSAVFALNSDWTLHIVDANSNVVQTATGSGMSMQYNWDGTSNGTNIPDGIYFYYIFAQTNGESSDVVSGGSGGDSGDGPPSPGFDSDISQMWAASSDTEYVLPWAIYPPGFDTNGLTIFEATPSQVRTLTASTRSVRRVSLYSGGSASPDISGGGPPPPSPQNPPVTPQRPPNNPIKRTSGTFGVAYDTYTGNGGHSYGLPALDNGLHVGLNISMNGHPASGTYKFAPVPPVKAEIDNFVTQMQHWGWLNALYRYDDTLSINDMRAGSIYNTVDLAVYIGHGSVGNGMNATDYAANQCKQMYFTITSGSSAQWLRMSEMNWGGSGAHGLKWMGLLCCNSLVHANWVSMQNAGIKPYNSNLHLLLGTETTNYTSNVILWNWAKYMNFGTGTNAASYNPLTIRQAWYQAAQDAYRGGTFPITIKFAVAGDAACSGDYLKTNSTPGGTEFIDTPVQVFP